MNRGGIPRQSRYGESPTIDDIRNAQFSTRMRKRKELFLPMILVAVPALDSGAATLFSTPDTTATALAELEVKGMRGQNGLESTAPNHTIDAAQIRTSGITDISDAMRRMPGVNLRDYGGSGGMKTVSVRGLGAQHTGVIYDGAMLGDIQGGQIDLSRYSLENLSSLSLSIGDADDIFIPARAVSSASTLSVSTLQNPDMMTSRPSLTVGIRAASFGTLNPSLRFAASNGHDLGMSLTGEYTHAKNNYPILIRNGSATTHEKRDNSQINLGHAEINGIWKPTAGSRLQAKAYWFDNSRHLPGPVTYYNSVSHERLRERNMFGQLSYSTKLGRMFSLKALAKYDHAYTRYRDTDGRYPNGKIDQKYTRQEEYVTATLLCRPVSGLSLSYSADFWHNSLHSNLRGENRPLRNSFLQALSVRWQWQRLTATARGLLSIIHDKSATVPGGKTEKRISPSAGISVRPLENADWHIRISYKDIMRMPTFNELYFDHYGSVNLSPETASQLNVGTTFSRAISSWLPQIELTLDGYLNHVHNKIVAMPYNMFMMTMTNLGRVRIAGLDATINAEFLLAETHFLLLSGNYSYQRAAPRTDPAMADWMKQVAYTPLNSGAWSLTWQNPWVNIVAHGSGCSARYSISSNIPSTRIGGYMETGLTAYRDFRLRACTLEARADLLNVFDKRYEIIARYPMPGLSWSVSLTLKM